MATIIFDTYGKTRVRLTYLQRNAERHDLKELTVQIFFEGEYKEVFTTGDNSKVLPTDTMKNTVYALARQKGIASIEEFARDLGRHFLGRVAFLKQVRIVINETPWARIGQYAAAFVQAGGEQRTVAFTATRTAETFVAGIHNLQILKSSDSAFAGYMKDEFTTLPETNDRLLGTILEAEWHYENATVDFDVAHGVVRDTLLEAFANHHSLSVQHTLFHMAETVVNRFDMISEIHLTMPNKHCLLVDLGRFGMDNPNQVFVPVDEPSGYIEARVRR